MNSQNLASFEMDNHNAYQRHHSMFEPVGVLPDRSLAPIDYACSIWMCPTNDRIARELSELSREVREEVWADLAANPKISTYESPVPDDSDVINKKLEELVETARGLPGNDAYLLAQQTAPNYVNDKSFQTMFLRAEKFDVKNAATRIVRHFDVKKRLFGKDLLGRNIGLSDLNEEETDLLSKKPFQWLDGTDHAGRRMLWSRYPKTSEYRSRETLYRVYWYVSFMALKEEDAQKLGVVTIMSFMDGYPRGGPDQELNRMQIEMMNALPLRIMALYVPYADSAWNATLDLLHHMLTPSTRLRTRTIHGSYEDCRHALECVGLPVCSLPLDKEGSQTTTDPHQLLRQRHCKGKDEIDCGRKEGALHKKGSKAACNHCKRYMTSSDGLSSNHDVVVMRKRQRC